MKNLRLMITFGIFGFLAGSAAFPQPREPEDRGLIGGTYLTTIKDSAGNFASRAVFTLHADHTMSGMDSGQGGPTYFFSSQRGSWRPDGHRRIAARMVDFLFLSSGPVIARLDYTIVFATDRSRVTGTIILRTFPLLDENPFDGEGDYIDTFTFVGEFIKP